MKRLSFIALLVLCLVLTGCMPHPLTYKATETGIGSGTIEIDFSINDTNNLLDDAVSFKFTDNGAKLVILNSGEFSGYNELTDKSVKTMDPKSAASVSFVSGNTYRLTVHYSGLTNGEYELHWKPSSSYQDGLKITAWNADGVQITDNIFIYSADPYDSIIEDNGDTSYITFSVTNNAVPKTGDGAHLMLWMALALCGCAGLVVFSRKRVCG